MQKKKQNAIQKDEMVQQSRVYGRWKILDRRIYDMSLVEIGSLFASQIKGQNFQKINERKIEGGGMAGNGRNRCAFYLPFRIYNFYDACRGGTVSKM